MILDRQFQAHAYFFMFTVSYRLTAHSAMLEKRRKKKRFMIYVVSFNNESDSVQYHDI